MRMGAILGAIGDPTNTRALAEQARTLAGEGFTSLWVPQAIGRNLIIHDPLITLTIAATVTEDIELGTAVLQVPLYQPMDLAHRIFSLQQLCGDRLSLGVGPGSTLEDYQALGRDYENRFKNFRTSMESLRTIFATGKLGESDLTPWAPVMGGPPLLLGSWGKGVARASRAYDGWMASAMHRTVDEVEEAAANYAEAGGGRSIVTTIVVGADSDLGEIRENLVRFREAGFDDAVVMIMPGGPNPAEVKSLMD